MATRYKDYVVKMLEENKEEFDRFKKIHDKYALNEEGLQNEFNNVGNRIIEIIKNYENRLCINQEKGIYNKYSSNLAEKFQQEIRKIFPMIDHVGLIVEKFELKKIRLYD